MFVLWHLGIYREHSPHMTIDQQLVEIYQRYRLHIETNHYMMNVYQQRSLCTMFVLWYLGIYQQHSPHMTIDQQLVEIYQWSKRYMQNLQHHSRNIQQDNFRIAIGQPSYIYRRHTNYNL